MVLADDLDGNGRLDLVLSTMNGNVYALETPAEFHTLKAWPSQVWTPGGWGWHSRHLQGSTLLRCGHRRCGHRGVGGGYGMGRLRGGMFGRGGGGGADDAHFP